MNNLIQKYSANAKTMAKIFGCSAQTVIKCAKTSGLNVEFEKGRRPSKDQERALSVFMGESEDKVTGENEYAEAEVCETNGFYAEAEVCEANGFENGDIHNANDNISGSEQAESNNGTKLDSFVMNFSGDVNVDMIANSLRYILGGAGKARIQIICTMD